MWAAQFRPLSPPRRARTPPPTPPHPLQIALPSALQYPFIEDRRTFLANRQIPATPPSSTISSDSLNSLGLAFSNDPMIVAGNNIRVHPGEWTQWDQLLYYFAQGRNMGRWAQDYLPFIAIVPEYLPINIRTPALATWTSQNGHSIWFDQIETRISSMSAGPVTSWLLLRSHHAHYARGNRSNAMAWRRIPDCISRHPHILT